MPGLAAEVVGLLRGRGETLATAESLTGGLVAVLITDVAGASAAFRGALVVYATDLKARLAGVTQETLDAVGPVAAQTAGELAAGAAARCEADWGLATTGVAGPDAQDGHPVGQVFVAVHGPAGSAATELRLSGDRAAIRTAAAEGALELLLGALRHAPAVSRRLA